MIELFLIAVVILGLFLFLRVDRGTSVEPYDYFSEREMITKNKRDLIKDNLLVHRMRAESDIERVTICMRYSKKFKVLVFEPGEHRFEYQNLPENRHYMSHGVHVTWKRTYDGREPGYFSREIENPSSFKEEEVRAIEQFKGDNPELF